MDNQPMREMSLIELINSLPETHIARKEYIKFLGRLSKEKNERLHLEQENKELINRFAMRIYECREMELSQGDKDTIALIAEQLKDQ